MYCEKNQNTWDEYLQQVMMAYRSSFHKSTSKTPNAMAFGREIVLPIQAVISTPDDSDSEQSFSDPEDYICNLKKKLQENHEIASKKIHPSAIQDLSHWQIGSVSGNMIYEQTRRILYTGNREFLVKPSIHVKYPTVKNGR